MYHAYAFTGIPCGTGRIQELNQMTGKFCRDILKSLGIGLGAGAALAVVLWLAGTVFGGFSMNSGLGTARAGMLIAGALGLFVLAGSNLFKRGGMELEHKDQWKRFFEVVSYKAVLGIVSAVFLGLGSLLDYFLFYL